MTVRRRISLLVAAAGFLASLVFSIAVFVEMIEQPFEILDVELENEAQRAARTLVARLKASGPRPLDPAANEIYTYWLKIFEQPSEKLIYESGLANSVTLPLIATNTSTITNAIVQRKLHPKQQGDGITTAFRIKSFTFDIDGTAYFVQIARPIEDLKEECWELIFSLAGGLFLSTLVLITASHFIAGRILKPIGEMKDLARRISEKNLNERLPVGSDSDEFNELAKTINRMLNRLQNSFTKQRNLLFDTSHELKTPLTTMRLAIDDISSSETTSMSSSSRKNFSQLNQQILRMERLVKDLLNLSSLEMMDAIEMEPVSISSILQTLIEDYRLVADAHKIELNLVFQELSDIAADRKKLTRALSNIIDNAIKYNVEDGRVTVEAAQHNDTITISVTNTGPGIPEDQIGKVFEQFFRVEKSRSIEHGGSGLGLAIVKRIIKLHNGSIEIKSQPKQWTRVTVRLPIQRTVLVS